MASTTGGARRPIFFRGGHRDPDQRVAAFAQVVEIPLGRADLRFRQVIDEAVQTVSGIGFHGRYCIPAASSSMDSVS